MSIRKRKREELDRLKTESRHSNDESKEKEEIQFQNEEDPMILKKPYRSYDSKNIDFDENLIASVFHWHKVTVSFDVH
jgi:hypothetical protein